MAWTVVFVDEFRDELLSMPQNVQDALLAHARVLAEFGPALGRPLVDTLAGSRHKNMKELRFTADGGVWRAAFEFDTKRQAAILVAGDKRGKSRFCESLIRTADARMDRHLRSLEQST